MPSGNVEVPVVDVKPERPPRVIKSRKVWSEGKHDYFYKVQPPYYKEFYRKNKCEQVRRYCYAVVNSSLSHHQRGVKCRLQLEDKVNSLSNKEESTD